MVNGEQKVNKIETAIQVIQQKAEKYSISGQQTAQVLQDIRNFKIKVVLVGAFSAGKSALLNAFLGQDLLREDQRPETAVASELLYDREEYVEIVTNTGIQRCPLAETNLINTESAQYFKWHLNNPALQELPGYILVDMPGFNSGIQAHNKAILQYADQANAYLLVIDAEDGGIKRSVSAFIDEVRNYENNMAIVITKSELKTDEDLELIKESVSETSADLFGYEVSVITTSKFDESVGCKLGDLIRQFDPDSIFRQTFQPKALEMGQQVIGVLEVLKKNINSDTSDLEKEIRTRERSKDKLTRKLQNERLRLSDKLQNKVQPAILADAENALYQQADVLASSLESGGSNFSMLVNNILRPVLVSSTKSYVDKSFDEFVSEISFSGVGLNEEERLTEIVNRYQQISNGIKNLPDTVDHFNAAYKAITTALAVTTSVVAPWLELVLIFLPDVIKAVSSLFQQQQQDRFHNEVCNKIIPGIIQKLNPEISNSLMELEQEMVQQLEEKMEEMIDSETSALENVRQQIEKKHESFAREVQGIDADIAEIRAALEAI